MENINFDRFKIKNPNYQLAFEELCYHLFCRKFELAEGVRADFNEVGLETKPIIYKDKSYGFQSKFFDGAIDYDQIEKSVTKALEKHKKLDTIIIYINRPLGTRAKGIKKIEDLAALKKVEIEWYVPTNFIKALSKHLDLAQFFFGQGDVLGFVKNYSPKKLTFVQSSLYFKLPFLKKNSPIDIEKDILKDKNLTSLILGNPGSGKTILMHRLFYILSGQTESSEKQMKALLRKNKGIPMLINLKDCIHYPLESLIRDRQHEYGLRRAQMGFIYLFDGLDELSPNQAENALLYISNLTADKETRKIIVSCRSGNPNRYLFRQYFKATEYETGDCKVDDIKTYFKTRNDTTKAKKLEVLTKSNPALVESASDIFLIKLFYETIEVLDSKSTPIDLFKEKIELQLNSPDHKKDIEGLNLLDSKQQAIIELNQDIAYEFQKKFQFRFKRKDLQKLISDKFPQTNYEDNNKILNFLSSQFFASSEVSATSTESFIYQHRRYQDFFLAQKLKKLYEENRKILRDNILTNSDFFEAIFLPFLRKEYECERNLARIIELNLINLYLGKSGAFGADEPYYSQATNFTEALGQQERQAFQLLLVDENLAIKSKMESGLNAAVTLWNLDKKVEARRILNEFLDWFEESKKNADGNPELLKSINDSFWSNWENWVFVRLVIWKEDAVDIFVNVIRSNYPNISNNDYRIGEDGKDKLINCFFRVCLTNKVKNWNKVLQMLDDTELLHLMKVCSEQEMLQSFSVQRQIQARFKKYLSTTRVISEDNYFLFFIKVIVGFKLDTEEKQFAEASLKKLRDRREVDWRMYHVAERYSLISFALGLHSFTKIDKEIRKKSAMMESSSLPYFYDELELHASLFRLLWETTKTKKKSVAQDVRTYLTYTEIYDKHRGLYLKFDISVLWGKIFVLAGDNKNQLSSLKQLLFKEDSNVSPQVFLLTLRRNSTLLFNSLVNEEEVDVFTDKLKDWDDDFPQYVEFCFDLAILYSTLNPNKAITYISRGINEGILRHGWHKDSIVSYQLVGALEILKERNWLTRKQLNHYAQKLMGIAMRVSSITDGKSTWRGPYNVLELISQFNIPLAEELRRKFIEEKGRRNVHNSSLTSIILAKVRLGLPIEELEKDMRDFYKEYDYESKPRADSYEQRIKVYLEIAKTDLYRPKEKKEAFLKAYEQMTELQKEGVSYYFTDTDFKNERKEFSGLCAKYQKTDILPDHKSSSSSYEPPKRQPETKVLAEIRAIKTKRALSAFYKKLTNYNKGVVLEKKESWDLLVEKTYRINQNIQPVLNYMKENWYPHTDYHTANSHYLHFALAACLRNPSTRDETLKYLYQDSGYQGFENTMKALEVNNEKELCLKLFRHFFNFCDFLVN